MKDQLAQGEVEEYCKAVWSPYPLGADLLYVWRMCLLAGIHVPYQEKMDKAIPLLQKVGWELLTIGDVVEPGDIAVYYRNKFNMSLEFVHKRLVTNEGQSYIGLGCQGLGRRKLVSRENISSSEDRAVAYFLRYRCKPCEEEKLKQENAGS
jgi:hypothetical protein